MENLLVSLNRRPKRKPPRVNGHPGARHFTVQTVTRSVPILTLLAVVAFSPSLCGEIRLLAVTTSAGYQTGLPGPGSPATIFCTGLSIPPVTAGLIGLGLPRAVDGITVRYADGTLAPIFGVADLSTYQIVNFQVPWEGPPGPIVLAQNGSTATLPPEPAPWGEFFTTADGNAIAAHAVDFTIVTSVNPARDGEWIVLYASNLGPVTSAPPTGNPAPSDRGTPLDSGAPVPWTFNATLKDPAGDRPLEMNYIGLAPGLTGVYQVNVHLPANLPHPALIQLSRSRDCGFFFQQGCGRGLALEASTIARLP